MTTLEEMEKREKEIKVMLENAESLEERKQLRTELRELRRKIFEAPTTTTTSISVTTKKEPEVSNTKVNIEKENAKNLDLNGNKRISVTLNTSKPTPITIETKIKADTTSEQETEKPRTTSSEPSTTSSNNMSSSVARRSRLFQTDDNNNASKTESSAPQANGIKLKINDGGDNTPTLRTRDPADRAARRARRAQQQREMSVDQGNTETNKEEAPKPTETVIVEAPKEEKKEEPKTTTEQRKSTSTLSVGGTGTKNTGSAGLRRTATWGAKDKNGAANNIGKALNKFGPQLGESTPFQFGTDYTKKNNTPKPENTPRSFNKYTPGVATVKAPYTPVTKSETSTNAQSNGSVESTGARRPSFNKYTTPAMNFKNSQAIKENLDSSQEPQESKVSSDVGTAFVPRKFSPTKDIMNQLERNKSSTSTPSYNKYTPNKNPDSGLNKVSRSVSMSAYERNLKKTQTPPEPSVSYNKLNRSISDSTNVTGLNRVGTSNLTGLNQVNSNNLTGLNRVGSTNSATGLRSVSEESNSSSTTKRPVSSYGGGGRFANLSSDPVPPPQPKPEPPKQNGTPSFGNPTGTQSAADRMAYFRQAAEAEKKKVEEKKAAAEARQKQQEMLNAVMNGEVSMGGTKKEEEEKTPATRKESNEGGAKKGGSSAPCKRREKKKVTRRTMSIGSIVLDWVQEMIKDYPVEVTNFSSSWNNGMAFCALIHAFNKDEFDFSELKPENKRYNFDLAFDTGYKVKKIPKLLDTDDMVAMARPEPRSVQTYIQWIWSVYGPTSGYGPTPQEVQK
ncbi:smoothelin-like isoform X2 [Clytia hemisphaerica]